MDQRRQVQHQNFRPDYSKNVASYLPCAYTHWWYLIHGTATALMIVYWLYLQFLGPICRYPIWVVRLFPGTICAKIFKLICAQLQLINQSVELKGTALQLMLTRSSKARGQGSKQQGTIASSIGKHLFESKIRGYTLFPITISTSIDNQIIKWTKWLNYKLI